MQFLAILMPLAGLVAFVGFVWLLVVAFRSSTLWGVLVLLFSPISAIVFAIKYWHDAKRPFLVYMGSCAGMFLLMFAMAMFVGGSMVKTVAEMQPAGQAGSFGNGERAEPDAVDVAAQFDPAAPGDVAQPGQAAMEPQHPAGTLAVVAGPAPAGEDSTASDAPAAEPVNLEQRNVIPVSQLDQHVGERVRVVTRDGSEFVGHYAGVHGSQLEFEKHLSAGVLAVFFERSELASVHKVRSRD